MHRVDMEMGRRHGVSSELASLSRLAAATIVSFAFSSACLADTGLVAQWSFNEASGGVAQDQGPNSLNGILVGGATFAPGIDGNALLPGVGYANVTTSSGSFPTALGQLSQGSISVWFKFNRLTNENEIFPIFYLGDGVGGPLNSSATIEIGHFGAGMSKVFFTILDDNMHIPLCFDSTFVLTPGQWYNYVASVGPDGNTGYLNGKEMITRHYNFGLPTATSFLDDVVDQNVAWIGSGFLGYVTNQQYFDGMIDELRVYDRPLTAAEVWHQYTSIAGLAGDANGDGKVSFADYLVLEANFGKTGMTRSTGDFNNDGKVSFADYLILEADFGKSVPEPASLALLGLGGLFLRKRPAA
jgi:hypothetical protein